MTEYLNPLRRMQEEIARANQAQGKPIARAEHPPEPEGYAIAAAPPPQNPSGVSSEDHDNKAERRINLDSKMVYGLGEQSFPLLEEEEKEITAVCIRAMMRHFNSIIESTARASGLWIDAPLPSEPSVIEPQNQGSSNVSSTKSGTTM